MLAILCLKHPVPSILGYLEVEDRLGDTAQDVACMAQQIIAEATGLVGTGDI